ncbi:protein FAM180A-like [Alosa pseudoharengus]|uniref:protein FAM180A-like n=1 Tax=Alosa sapidissima TaxID=34773 RepID=UPI001C086A1D|nr:protein FAM180A-like [Alosa sapidissima]
MAPRWFVILTLLQCALCFCFSHRQYRALFPAVHRARRGTAAMVNPVFQKSIKDVDLFYEILDAGLDFPDEHVSFHIHDEELASLRHTHILEVICEDFLPKKLTDIRRLTSALSQHAGSATLRREDFERTLLTMVYSAQHVAQASSHHQRELWAESFVELFRAIKRDLAAK